MSQEVTLSIEQSNPSCTLTFTIHVEKAVLTDMHVRLEGLDPSQYPEELHDHVEFYSKNLTTVIESDSNVTVESITPSTKPVPTTSP